MTPPGASRAVAEHLSALLDGIGALPAVDLALADAVGRVLAADVEAAVPVPRFDHAAMDGYAVRAADIAPDVTGAGAGPGGPGGDVSLPVVAAVGAGAAGPSALEPGAAVRIMTGAPVPPGADTVVPFEATTGEGDRVRLPGDLRAGAHIRRAGEDVAAGETLARAGDPLDPRTAGLLAAAGVARVAARPAPRLVVLTTGSELVPAGTDPAHLAPGAIHDSTAVTLVAEARALGAEVRHRGPVGDDPEAFLVLLHDAVRDADLVVTTGGVSAGDHDVVKAALAGRGGFWFGQVAVRPGRPQGHGVLHVDGEQGRRAVPVVNLPGTPAASYLTFQAFVRPLLAVLSGADPDVTVPVTLGAPVRRSPDRTLLLPGGRGEDGRAVVLPGHVGHSQRLLARTELVLVVPPGSEELPEGARIGAIVVASAATGESGHRAGGGR
ncbi:molybdopterin molybdotransferase MoeA [Nocardioides sambongensis]|uniref:molybdopterin molybdotransferase MoeA n=1 Tax=Nocardioides sambongensis TaxID=2589074 RepID=UPI00112EA3A4|nr:gephyrin-like molybdotransferase Glp [Nocardioides sambongensis]